MNIHIEGAGIQGCLLMHFLDMAGIKFTWHDIDARQTAWKASTGAIYPANSTKFGDDHKCWQVWRDWHEEGRIAVPHVEACSWWFNHKSTVPHGGKYQVTRVSPAGLRMGELPAFHFNAQTFVPETRERFAKYERQPTGRGYDTYIISHGWGLRQSHVYWGWTRLVELDYSRVTFNEGYNRPSFYFRDGRFIMAYAYPVPGTPYWYAGSNIIKQNSAKARSLHMEPKYEKWKANFERLGRGEVQVVAEDRFIEGWRPAARDDAWSQMTVSDGIRRVEFRPLWNNGIRHFPQQLNEFAKKLGIPELKLLSEPCASTDK